MDHPIPKFVWLAKIPHKIKIFLWLLARRRLPAGGQLCIRHGPSDGFCALCDQWEDSNHIDHFWALLLPLDKKSRKLVWLLFAALSWAIWNIRNKFSIEALFPNKAVDCFFKTGILL